MRNYCCYRIKKKWKSVPDALNKLKQSILFDRLLRKPVHTAFEANADDFEMHVLLTQIAW